MSESLHRHFRAEGTAVRLDRGDSVYSSGQTSHHLYLIESGWTKLHRLTESGKSCILGMHGAGEVVGETCLFEDMRSQTASALSSVLLRRLPRRRFLDLLALDELREDWLRYQVHRTTQHEHARTLLVTADSEHRLAAAVLDLATRHGILRRDLRLLVDHHFTQEEFAEMVGTTRSRVGLFLNRFREMGLLARDPRGRLLVDRQRIERYLAERDGD